MRHTTFLSPGLKDLIIGLLAFALTMAIWAIVFTPVAV
jgi:hypothetical protein